MLMISKVTEPMSHLCKILRGTPIGSRKGVKFSIQCWLIRVNENNEKELTAPLENLIWPFNLGRLRACDSLSWHRKR